MATSDLELVALVVASRDQRAFSKLISKYEVLIRAMLTRMTGNHALAEDLAQETFLRAWRKIDSFSGKGSFKSWLCRIAYTEFLQSYRKRKSTAKVLEKLTRHTEIENQIARPWDTGDAMDLDKALGQLSEVERGLIVLCYSVGMTHEEAAIASKLPLGTVKSHIKRGKEKMRQILLASDEVIR